MSRVTNQGGYSDSVHGVVVVIVCLLATIYATLVKDHSNNIWIVYGSSIAYAAGRAGAGVFQTRQANSRRDDQENGK